MITKKVIDEIYKKYRKPPKSSDELEVELLFTGVHPDHNVEVDGERLKIGSVPEQSPFHEIPMRAICSIVDFEWHVAVVMHSSILFLNKDSAATSVHIKPYKPSLLTRLRRLFHRGEKM